MFHHGADFDIFVLGLQVGRNDDAANVHVVFYGSFHLSLDPLNWYAIIDFVLFDAEPGIKVFWGTLQDFNGLAHVCSSLVNDSEFDVVLALENWFIEEIEAGLFTSVDCFFTAQL